ncbi:MAG TPA: serine/threonine-protein kinase [Candidatus Acidoferrales bacterium]|nr:serine/threonine-protein kinase [Candidatus Acidoferrales bacterium]
MADLTKPQAATPRPGDPRSPVELQKTLLLSEVPEADAVIPDLTPKPDIEPTGSLSPAALAALSQRYEILAEAGQGSMGNVYKARDRETREVVALKLLKSEIASDQTMIERFKNELLFARKITHKNVCRVYEFNRIGPVAYTSMEFVEGESLRSVLNRFGGLPTRKAIDLVGQICSGLKEAHAQGIVHRDLKPENVMIDGQGNVKIMDFGIARSMEAVTRLTGSMVGTPAYMAPEQVAGKAVDYRTDIYSLGLILYELFTGAQAFQAENAVAVALKQMRESPIPPHEIEPMIPVAIERAILKCLEKEPVKRFQSIPELEAALRSPLAPAAPQAAVNYKLNHSSHAPALPHSFAAAAEPKRTSPVTWVLFGALLVVGGYAGWHYYPVAQATMNLLPPAAPAPPAPPDFALNTTPAAKPAADQTPATAQPAAPAPADAKSDTDADKSAETDSETPAPAKVAPLSAPHESAAAKNQNSDSAVAAKPNQHPASQGFGENEPVSQPPVNDHTPSYLWVGRFEREDKAQSSAKKIQDLGLPVTVVPRPSLTGQVYVVVTGPYGPERVESAMDYLKTQGFSDVRLIKNPMGGQRNQSH